MTYYTSIHDTIIDEHTAEPFYYKGWRGESDEPDDNEANMLVIPINLMILLLLIIIITMNITLVLVILLV